MASGMVARDGDSGLQAPGSGEFVEYHDFIERQLRRTRGHVRSVDVGAALLTLFAGVMGYLLLVVLADHWLFSGGLNFWGRLLALAALLAGAGYYFASRVAPLLLRRINPVYAAHTIERSTPSLKNGLINFLLLRSNRAGVPDAVFTAVEEQAVAGLADVPVETAVDRSKLLRLAYVLMGVVAAFALYTLLSPKSPFASVERIFAPWADMQKPTRVSFVDLQPGNADVFRGQRVAVNCEIKGLRENEQAVVVYSTLDRQVVDQRLPMYLPEGKYRYECLLPASEAGIQQDLEYHLEAGDAVSRVYRLQGVTAPTIVVDRVDYAYPRYTGLDPKQERTGDVKAVEGTQITIHATANQPIKEARIYFDDGAKGVSLTVDSQGQTAIYPLTLKLAAGREPERHTYRVGFTSLEGKASPAGVAYKIEITPDQPPEISFTAPQREQVDLPIHQPLAIGVSASDPDFALNEVMLVVFKNNAILWQKQLYLQPAANQPDADKLRKRAGEAFSGKAIFDPRNEDFGLKVGDVLEYQATATDIKEPKANQAVTARRKIQIVAAGSPGQNNPANDPNDANPQDQNANRQPGDPKEQQPADDRGQRADDKSQRNPTQQRQPGRENDDARENRADHPPGAREKPDDANAQPGKDPQGKQQPDGGKSDNAASRPNDDSQHRQPGDAQSNQDPNDSPSRDPNQKASDAEAIQKLLKDEQDRQQKNSAEPPQAPDKQSPDKQSPEKQAPDQKAPEKQPDQKNQNSKPDANQKPGGEQKSDASQKSQSQKSGDGNSGGSQQQPGGDQKQDGGKSGDQQGNSGQKPDAGQKPDSGQKPDANQKPGGEKSPSGNQGQAGDKPQPGEKGQPGNPPQKNDAAQPQGDPSGQQPPKDSNGQKPGEQKSGDQNQKPGEQKSGDQKPGGQQPDSQKPAGQGNKGEQPGGKPDGGQGQESPGAKGDQSKSNQPGGEPKGADGQKPDGQKPDDQKSDGQKSGDQKSGDPKSDGQKGNGPKSGDQKPDGSGQPGDQPPDGSKPAGPGQKPSGDAGQKPAGDKAGDPNAPHDPASAQPGENAKSGPHAGDKPQQNAQPGKAAGEKQAGDKQPGEKQSGDKQPGEKQPGGEKPAGDPQAQQRGDGGQAHPSAPPDDKQPKAPPGAKPDDNLKPKGGNPDAPKGDSGNGSGKSDKGSPANQEPQSPVQNKPDDATAKPNDDKNDDSAQSAAHGRENKSKKEGDSGDLVGPGGKGGGQGAKRQGTGGHGQNTPSDEGKGQANEPGQGELSNKPGDTKSDQPSGTPGNSVKADGGKSQSSTDPTGRQKPNSDKKPGDPDGAPQSKGDQPGGAPAAGNAPNSQAPGQGKGQGPGNGGGNGGGSGTGDAGSGNGAAPDQADEPNLEYARKATDLALERLKHQKDAPDPNLLKQLGWTKDDMQNFINRWEQMKRDAQAPGPQGDNAREQFNDSLRSLGLRPGGASRAADRSANDNQRGLNEGHIAKPPAEYAEQFKAYQQSVGRGP